MQRKRRGVKRIIRYMCIRLFRKTKRILRFDSQRDSKDDSLFVRLSVHSDMTCEPVVQSLLKKYRAPIVVPGFLLLATILQEKSKAGRIGTLECFSEGILIYQKELWLKAKRVSTKYIEYRSPSLSEQTNLQDAPDNNRCS